MSNELIDNFPVHRVVMNSELMEVFVNYKDGFTELLEPAGTELKAYLEENHIELPKGYTTEINLDAIKWMKQIAGSLGKGYVIIIDYGYTASEFYNNRRRLGTMLCYHDHRVNDSPYDDIGEQDITTHVNFSALCHWGFKYGLTCCGLTTQADFLLSLGYKDYFIKKYRNSGDMHRAAVLQSQLNRLLIMEMGTKFKVLIQKKTPVN